MISTCPLRKKNKKNPIHFVLPIYSLVHSQTASGQPPKGKVSLLPCPCHPSLHYYAWANGEWGQLSCAQATAGATVLSVVRVRASFPASILCKQESRPALQCPWISTWLQLIAQTTVFMSCGAIMGHRHQHSSCCIRNTDLLMALSCCMDHRHQCGFR